MKTLLYTSIIALMTIILGSCSYNRSAIETPEYLQMSKLEGVWYEIASLPAREPDECHCVTLEIDIENKDRMLIRNQCLMGDDGKAKFAEAYVNIDNETRQGKLDVHYNNLKGTPYWVVDIDDPTDKFLVLAHPNGDYLWLLGREASITSDEYWMLRDEIADAGFETAFLAATDQSCYGGWVESEEPAKGSTAVE